MRKKFSVNTILGNNKTRRLNPNDSLQNIVLQMRIYYLPEIFNICKINNLKRLKSINLGYLDEITFKGFVNDYKQNCQQLKCLTSIKISLSDSVLFFCFDKSAFINFNSFKINCSKFLGILGICLLI